MFGVECFDTHDEPISHYTQWDINQTLKIVLYGMDDGYMKSAPYVHFANSQSYEALVVRSTLQGDNTIIVDIPNVLLQEPWPLLVYIYLNDSTDAKSQKTIVKLDIPVQKRVKPSDYEYVENIDKITAEVIKQEIYDDFMDEIRSGNIAYPYVTLIDESTGKHVNLKVSDEKFGLYVDSTNRQLLDTGDIVNNLMTDSSTKVLSASMGATIKNMVDVIPDNIDEKIEEHDSSPTSHSDIRDDISSVSSAVDTMQNSIAEIENKIDDIDFRLDDTISGSGILTTTDTLVNSSPIEMRIKGNTRQNLWANPKDNNYEGVVVTSEQDGSITLSGRTTSSDIWIGYEKRYVLKPGSTYTLSVDKEVQRNVAFRVEPRDADGTIISATSFAVAASKKTATSTIPSNAAYVNMLVSFTGSVGTTVSGTYHVMLNEGSTAQPWCPPGLNSVDELSVVTAGKNLCKPFTHGKVTANDDGSMTVEASEVTWANGTINPINIPAGTQVTVSTDNMYSGNVGFGFYFIASDNSRTEAHLYSRLSRTIQLSEDCVAYQCWFNGATDSAVTSHVMMEIGSTATSFEPYQGSTTPIDLDGHTLCSLPNGTCDELTIDATGAVTLTKRVCVADYEASDFNVAPTSKYTETALYKPYAGGVDFSRRKQRSDFAPIGNADTTVGYPVISAYTQGTNTVLRGGTGLTEASPNEQSTKFKSLLGSATWHHLYALAAPQTISLPPVTLPSFPSDKSNIYTTSNVPTAGLTVRYWKKGGELVANLYKLLRNHEA